MSKEFERHIEEMVEEYLSMGAHLWALKKVSPRKRNHSDDILFLRVGLENMLDLLKAAEKCY